MREERRLRGFENRRIFRPEGRDKEEWRTLNKEGLNDLYTSPDVILVIKSKRMRRVGHVVRMGERKGAYTVLVGKPKGKRPLGGSKRRWEDNIKMDLQEVGLGACTGLIWLRMVTGGGDEPSGSIKWGEFLD